MSDALQISPVVSIQDEEIQVTSIRAQGAGGQNVNKVASAVHLRFDVAASSLPQRMKERLLALKDARITGAGDVVIKAQRFRSRDKNLADARERLRKLLVSVAHEPKQRVPTRPPRAAKERRLEQKARRSRTKQLRRPAD